METTKNKYFAPINNFNALKEAEEKHYSNSQTKNLDEFLDFWQFAYNAWRKNFSPFEVRFTEEKVRVRKELIKILGIRH